MYRVGEEMSANSSKAISLFVPLTGVHLGLTTILECAKGFADPNRGLYQFRAVVDIKSREGQEENSRLASYFLSRDTPPETEQHAQR